MIYEIKVLVIKLLYIFDKPSIIRKGGLVFKDLILYYS